ncbi:MAG TPA: rod shape-determining protein RodA [Gemmatimonadaceae bacterium]
MRRLIGDPPLFAIALALSLYGLSIVYSAGQTDVPTVATHAWRAQTIWIILAIGVSFAIGKASVRMLDWVTIPLFTLTLLGLAATLLGFGCGAGTAASTKSWICLGSHRIGQPSELAKVTVVLMLARVLSAKKDPPKTLAELWPAALVVGIPWLMIMLQPDLGTGLAFIGIFFGMLFWAGVSWPLLLLIASPVVSLIGAVNVWIWGAWFIILIVLVYRYRPYLGEGIVLVVANFVMGVLAPILWDRLQPYQQKRLLTYLDPTADARGSGYHVIQSIVAIGSGGWFGKGYTLGTQKRLAFLPAQHTDFIFSVVGEELGFVGVTLALSLFLLLLLRTIRIATRANDSFSSLIAIGLAASWFVHMLINVGMTLSLMPITGIPLPFFSYGGSFMLASWLSVGILMRIASEGRGGRTDFAV